MRKPSFRYPAHSKSTRSFAPGGAVPWIVKRPASSPRPWKRPLPSLPPRTCRKTLGFATGSPRSSTTRPDRRIESSVGGGAGSIRGSTGIGGVSGRGIAVRSVVGRTAASFSTGSPAGSEGCSSVTEGCAIDPASVRSRTRGRRSRATRAPPMARSRKRPRERMARAPQNRFHPFPHLRRGGERVPLVPVASRNRHAPSPEPESRLLLVLSRSGGDGVPGGGSRPTRSARRGDTRADRPLAVRPGGGRLGVVATRPPSYPGYSRAPISMRSSNASRCSSAVSSFISTSRSQRRPCRSVEEM